ncbi:MurG-like transferase [Planctomycetes bacterium Poly30]|uniref:MurG-like transferase n=1 Tax=Saltatorellus ferox TaxID=2528018 RepID=A0A518EQG5_9BACT|nr:MurG-like transferase [Planctomycetes bacterium Poly30]
MKIFVTVGSQLPFDRLVRAVDTWAAKSGRGSEIVAQVGATATTFQHFGATAELDPAAFRAAAESADILVGHAGTGTIMAALCAGKPVVVLARRESLHETRNDHQVATIERFRHLPGFHGTIREEEIPALIDAALTEARSLPPEAQPLRSHASGAIVDRLRSFLDEALS